MASPVHQRSVVDIGGIRFHAHSCEVSVGTAKDELGLPQMGTQVTQISISVDMHDEDNLPFDKIQGLFDLANIVTSDKIQAVSIDFLRDENPDNVIVNFNLDGWIKLIQFSNHSPTGVGSGEVEGAINDRLYIEIEPRVNEMNYKEIKIGN
jgi:hypothetical protein